MSLLIPLGLLSLISILILILIYIIRPNYEQKLVSSTFVWKLSMKYKKKRIPISKIRNLILVLCQILILVACAFILSKPVQVTKTFVDDYEAIAIVDSSASMRTQTAGETRYERAVDKVESLSDEIFGRQGFLSVIIADENPYYFGVEQQDGSVFSMLRAEYTQKSRFQTALRSLVNGDDLACSYGSSDIEAAMELCNEVLEINPSAQIYLYTDKKYSFVPQGITVVDVSEREEWNAAILNARTQLDDNYYTFFVDVACYGKDAELNVNVEIIRANPDDANPNGNTIKYTQSVVCDRDNVKTVVFRSDSIVNQDYETEDTVVCPLLDNQKVFAYESVHIFVTEQDNFESDNDYFIYGGEKRTLKIQYASSLPNPFFQGVLPVLQNRFSSYWNIEIAEPKKGQAADRGFDLYIYEHTMPKFLPNDGVVMLVNPDVAPAGSLLTFGREVPVRDGTRMLAMKQEMEHPLLQGVNISRVGISYVNVTTASSGYEILASCGNIPTILLKENDYENIMVLAFDLHKSNLGISSGDFYMLMRNMILHFFPSTVDGTYFQVDEDIKINSRVDKLTVKSFDGSEQVLEKLPANISLHKPGTYELIQIPFGHAQSVVEKIYVSIPSEESNVCKLEDVLYDPRKVYDANDYYNDLLVWLAAALVGLLFLEWLLQARDNM